MKKSELRQKLHELFPEFEPISLKFQLVEELFENYYLDNKIADLDGDSGITLIAKERLEQFLIHGKTIEADINNYPNGELADVAHALTLPITNRIDFPDAWRQSDFVNLSIRKSRKQRLILAGAIIAAELDRLNAIGEE